MKAITWNPLLRAEEFPPPVIPKGWIFGKVLKAMISPLDRILMKGFPIPLGRIPGGYGVVRVLEPGVSSKTSAGEVYGVIPYCDKEVLGITVNGLMGEYATVPTKCLVRVAGVESTYLPLWLEFSFMEDLKKKIDENKRILVIGCGFTSYIIALNVETNLDITFTCVNGGFMKQIAETGAKVISVSKLNNYTYNFDFIILESQEPFYVLKSLEYIGNNNTEKTVYVLPENPDLLMWLPPWTSNVRILRARFGKISSGVRSLEKLKEEHIKKYVAVTNELEEVPTLFKHFNRVIYEAKP